MAEDLGEVTTAAGPLAGVVEAALEDKASNDRLHLKDVAAVHAQEDPDPDG